MIVKVYYLEYIELIHRPDDGDSTHLRNVGLPQRDYISQKDLIFRVLLYVRSYIHGDEKL
jgi:hypothetical protein